jgi:hypothetical protein
MPRVAGWLRDQCFTVPVAGSQINHMVASYVKDFEADLDNAIVPTGIWLNK